MISCAKMISTIIQIVIVFGCLALSFGTATLPLSKWNNNPPQTYRLPSNTKPETFNLSLHTRISEGHFDYDGLVSTNILVMNATRVITVHSVELTIQSIQLSHANGSKTAIELLPWQINNDTQFLVIPTKNIELQRGTRYRLDIKFVGTLNSYAEGFYRTTSSAIDKR